MGYDFEDNKPNCTCDTPSGSENRRCSYCQSKREVLIVKKPKKGKENNMDSVITEKGTKLPLLNLRGKSYLMVGHRLQWLAEKYDNYDIFTEFLLITDEQTVARATVTILDKDGKVVRKAMATKRETKKDFPDHSEKAETSAIGRALSMLGLGTQHALSDLDEGTRLADSPVENVKQSRGSSSRYLPDNAALNELSAAMNARKEENFEQAQSPEDLSVEIVKKPTFKKSTTPVPKSVEEEWS